MALPALTRLQQQDQPGNRLSDECSCAVDGGADTQQKLPPRPLPVVPAFVSAGKLRRMAGDGKRLCAAPLPSPGAGTASLFLFFLQHELGGNYDRCTPIDLGLPVGLNAGGPVGRPGGACMALAAVSLDDKYDLAKQPGPAERQRGRGAPHAHAAGARDRRQGRTWLWRCHRLSRCAAGPVSTRPVGCGGRPPAGRHRLQSGGAVPKPGSDGAVGDAAGGTPR